MILHPKDDFESAGRRYVQELRDEIADAPWDTKEQRKEILHKATTAFGIEQTINGLVDFILEKEEMKSERAAIGLLDLSGDNQNG